LGSTKYRENALVALVDKEFIAPAGNRSQAVHPVVILIELSQLIKYLTKYCGHCVIYGIVGNSQYLYVILLVNEYSRLVSFTSVDLIAKLHQLQLSTFYVTDNQLLSDRNLLPNKLPLYFPLLSSQHNNYQNLIHVACVK
jgi:hypothetical protein